MAQFSFCRSIGLLLALAATCPGAFAGNSGQLTEELQPKHHGKHAGEAKQAHVPEVKHSIVVNAKAAHVWAAIQHQRKSEDCRKLLSYDGSSATLRETFGSLPIVGQASCDYVEHESTPLERIDYNLVSSNRFNVFEGSWILSPGKNGTTVVELSNAIDPGIRVPFWQDITKCAASKMVKHRLDAVSSYAEQLEKNEIASRIR